MATPTIQVKNLSKTFTYHKKAEGLTGSIKSLIKRERLKKEAVKNVSFSIDKGEFVGFIGPNGAGKTTTLKMLSGILYPTEGTVRVAGHDPAQREIEYKKMISIVMGQKSLVWPLLPAIETLVLLQRMYDVPDKVFRKRLNELTELLDVGEQLNVQVRKLSLGQRMKFEIIAALIHAPKVLFLDEPTIGLDVVSQKKIREFLKKYNEESGTTIILTSHYMDDVQDLCERIIIINEGEVGYDGSVENIIENYSKDKIIKVMFSDKVLKKDLIQFGKVLSHELFEAELSIPIKDANKKVSKLINQFPVRDINIKGITLEEVVSDIFSSKRIR